MPGVTPEEMNQLRPVVEDVAAQMLADLPRKDQRAKGGLLVDLLAAWPATSPEPTDSWLSTLPADIPLRDLVRITER